MASILYGYTRSEQGIIADSQKSKTVKMIFDTYLSGVSLVQLIERLHEANIPSTSGKEKWSSAMLHKMLSDSRYIPLVGFEQYIAVEFELEKRSNRDENTGNRKTTRYHSENVLSGLFVCAECGRNYRRVQRASGEMVWRCANRVEHGNKTCKSSPSITEADAIRFVCGMLITEELEPQAVNNGIETITVHQDGNIVAELTSEMPAVNPTYKTMK